MSAKKKLLLTSALLHLSRSLPALPEGSSATPPAAATEPATSAPPLPNAPPGDVTSAVNAAHQATQSAQAATAAATKASTSADETAGAANRLTENVTEAKFDELRSGKLIQYGVTGGISFAIASELSTGSYGAKQEGTAVTTMPYVLLLPRYWFGTSDITRAFCATAYGSDAVLARAAAVNYARRKAVETLHPAERALYDRKDPTVVDKVEELAFGPSGDWKKDEDGSCGWYKWGVFVGKPIAYDASMREVSGGRELKGEISSSFSAGVGFAPNAYVTLMLGLAANYIVVDTQDDENSAAKICHLVIRRWRQSRHRRGALLTQSALSDR